MKKIRELWHRLIRNRKVRCGGFSVVLTALVICLCAAVAALADGLEKRYALTGDYSFNAATLQGDVSRAVLEGLEKDVHIYAVIPAEGENQTLMQLLERMQALSAHLTVRRENIAKNPVLTERFSDALGDNKVTDDCLIIHCPQTGRSRVLDEDDYYTYAYDTKTGQFSQAGFTYEKSVTEALLYVTEDTLPTVQLLTGQGELTKADVSALEQLLVSANYGVEWVQLGQHTLDPQSPLLILSPTLDLTEQELDMLMAYAAAGGDFLIAVQYSDPMNLSRFNALLRAYGVEMLPGLVIASQEDKDSYYGDLPVYLMPYMQETEATRPLMENAMDILVLPGARAFRIETGNGSRVQAAPVLQTGKAYIRNYTDGLATTDQQETDLTGTFALAVWTDKMFEDGTQSHALVIGNADVLCDEWMHNNTHAASFVLQMLRSLQGMSPVNLDIVPKNALREGLQMTGLAPAMAVTLLLPVLVLIGALLVLLPRRSR